MWCLLFLDCVMECIILHIPTYSGIIMGIFWILRLWVCFPNLLEEKFLCKSWLYKYFNSLWRGHNDYQVVFLLLCCMRQFDTYRH